MSKADPICTNWSPDHTGCQKSGRYTCQNCKLVTYCGRPCQTAHWPRHKVDCRSPLGKETWQPAWSREGREPAFLGGGYQEFGNKKYPWGNIPAFDVLQLSSNEGVAYDEDVSLLFAASGDLRNVIKTISQVPESYKKSISLTINDRDIDIVARNVIMLLIALFVNDPNEAVLCIIHVWYSSLLRKSDLAMLQGLIRPLLQAVCDSIKDKGEDAVMAKTWSSEGRELRVVLTKSSWDRLVSFLDVPAGLTVERATRIRTEVTLAESRRDFVDRHMCCQPTHHRVPLRRFREDGLLLPFGYPRHEFVTPNPTFFQNGDSWPMMDSEDPLLGWSPEDVAETSSGAATADIYGKLFYFLRTTLSSFLGRMSTMKLSFELLQVDTKTQVSNISDTGYVGIHTTLALAMPCLQPVETNPHATLITLFMNSIEEFMTDEDHKRLALAGDPSAERVLKYLYPPPNLLLSRYDPFTFRFMFGKDLVAPFDHIFARYTEHFRFQEFGALLGAVQKERHTLVPKWPCQLKLQPGQEGEREEFDRLLASGLCGKERYVEWQRVATQVAK
ncbi:hypothetical protein S7711_03071 [Stachybotrys chartarum IBT 7711]|uniref:MYND-type domain-containing protein n=1 Tax=Stachybotrys chartarum (strain CBS 109288 / IBT 7711) TaxID=1280523 RepID=A0A084B883_STACB|nr:hypothetical protein S7711_03071 [Stachybotrys chartarum IBT 7711]